MKKWLVLWNMLQIAPIPGTSLFTMLALVFPIPIPVLSPFTLSASLVKNSQQCISVAYYI
jgi:hypothetical protein